MEEDEANLGGLRRNPLWRATIGYERKQVEQLNAPPVLSHRFLTVDRTSVATDRGE